jgi:ABC-2 type transport system permease protein
MYRKIKHIYLLGIKELKSLVNELILVLFLVYAFTINVWSTAESAATEVKNASIAIVDEDHSAFSRSTFDLFRLPYFKTPVSLDSHKIDSALESGQYTFILDIPPKFTANLLAGRQPQIQLNVDATAISQAYIGAAYIQQIIATALQNVRYPAELSKPPPFDASIRVKYNPNREQKWYQGVTQMLFNITMLSMILPGAALLREKEHGTIEHLLVMPLTPAEIILSKVWSNALVVIFGTILSLVLVIKPILHVPMQGSYGLFFLGTLIFQFAITMLGIALATISRTVPQHAIITILILMPMMFLSGAWTPMESMHPIIRTLMFVSPLKYYNEFATAVFFRGSSIEYVWSNLLILIIIGGGFFIFSLIRFRLRFSMS